MRTYCLIFELIEVGFFCLDMNSTEAKRYQLQTKDLTLAKLLLSQILMGMSKTGVFGDEAKTSARENLKFGQIRRKPEF